MMNAKSTLTVTRITQLLFVLVFVICNGSIAAEEIAIPAGQQGDAAIVTPSTGQNKTNVASSFGQPLQTSGSIGDPPISRWEYDQFYVYFEYDHVIHSVLKK